MSETDKSFMEEARKEALKSTCLRRKCGSVIVLNGKVIGRGFNSPPKDLESQRRCLSDKSRYDRKVTDKTCCVHAEQRAMFDAIANNKNISGAVLYFASVDDKGEHKLATEPYCTICSKSALDLGIEQFILLHKEGLRKYDIEEYNSLSYNFKE